MVNIGEKIANFSLPATGDKNLSLDDFKARGVKGHVEEVLEAARSL